MKPRTRFALGCVALIAVPFVLLLLLAFWRGMSADWTISRARWRFASDKSRLSMAQDYIATRRVAGKTRDQVEHELGDPSRTYDYWSYAVSSRGLGEPDDRGVPPRYDDEPTLYVQFGAADRVARLWSWNVSKPSAEVEFDAALWGAFVFFKDQRLPLAYDLIEDKELVGASRKEVRSALGPPDSAELAYYYQVGVDDSGDERGLIVWFDESGRVTRTLIEDEGS